MYVVYVDNKVLYSPVLETEGYSLLSAKVIKELNKAGSFVFTLPPNSIMYGGIQKLKSIVRVVNGEITAYRIQNGEKFSATSQMKIPVTVLYKTAIIDEITGTITLENPLNTEGSNAKEQYENVKEYGFFYGDKKDGTQDNTVYKYLYIDRTVSSGAYPIIFYSYFYYKQEVYKDVVEKEIFRGRTLNTEKDFYKRKNVYCEGELAFLLDSIQRPYSFQGDIPDILKYYLGNHNNQVDDWKQFQLGNVTVTDANGYINRESIQYPNTLDEMQEKLVKTYGGYWKIRSDGSKRYLDYLKKSGKQNSQTIEFGTNLLDITEYITAEDVFTVLIPLGGKIKDEVGNEIGRLTIESVNNGKDFIENEVGISLFGRITKKHEWDDVSIADNLLKKGKVFLESGIEMAVSLTLKAIDLHLVNVDEESISIGDYVRVISPQHNIDTFFQCTKIELDLLNPGNSVYEFGVSFTSLTGKLTKG